MSVCCRVEVFVKLVEERSHELLGVLLLVAPELGDPLPKSALERRRGDSVVAARPHGAQESPKIFSKPSLRSQRVVRMQVCPEPLGHKVLVERHSVAQALERAVHEACIPHISEPANARHSPQVQRFVLLVGVLPYTATATAEKGRYSR